MAEEALVTNIDQFMIKLIDDDRLDEFKTYGKTIRDHYYVFIPRALRLGRTEFINYLKTLEIADDAAAGYQLLWDADDPLDLDEWKEYLSLIDSNFEQLLVSVILYEFTGNAEIAVKRIIELYSLPGEIGSPSAASDFGPPKNMMSQYYNLALDVSNDFAMNALAANMEDMEFPDAPTPGWMISFGEQTPAIRSTSPPDMYVKELGNLTQQLSAAAMGEAKLVSVKRYGDPGFIPFYLEVAEMVKRLAGPIDPTALANVAQKFNMEVAIPTDTKSNAYTVLKLLSLGDDINLRKLAGPVNLDMGLIANTDDECTKLGGCRMLICRHFTDEDEDVTDWFLGYCEVCFRLISSRSRALRQPLPTGGYVGCYDSEICCRKGIRDRYQKPSDRKQADAFLDVLLSGLDMLGIIDREVPIEPQGEGV